MHIESFKKEQNAEIKELVTSIMAREYADDQKAYQYGDLDNITEAYGSLREKFLVAYEGTALIGIVGIKEDSEKVALLRRFFIHPSHRGRSAGSALVDTALDFCKMNNYSYVNFRATSSMQAAIKLLCNRKGFVEKDRCPFEGIEIVNLVYKIR